MSDSVEDFVGDGLVMASCRTAELAAIASSVWVGRGDQMSADRAAVEAMREYLNSLAISGVVVIGEGERDEAPMLYIGEEVGRGGISVDIALDPLEGTGLCASAASNSLAVIGMSEGGSGGGHFLNAPDVYMDKIAVGVGVPVGSIDLDNSVGDNIVNYANFVGKSVGDVVVCILDRPRHERLISDVRAVGARVKLIGDGDIYAVIATTMSSSGIDMYMGSGGAPEGVLAASSLRCVGGFMQGRLLLQDESQWERWRSMGIEDSERKYGVEDLASGDVIFAASGVTSGDLVGGVEYSSCGCYVTTETIVMRSRTGSVRTIRARHDLQRLRG